MKPSRHKSIDNEALLALLTRYPESEVLKMIKAADRAYDRYHMRSIWGKTLPNAKVLH